ncbi:hypothetical protein CPB84DRAFT_1754198 [Gymnopilus junonius]|uniref:DEAD/DEAH-box helicase domain-containing protein n=1 Tax=Gymnopilus junonius TaxID=109634 RepID=A0A9P5TEQ4_GYMJU|nr:hypothetical protein CPB84DRAFT_1754198 [Gymnopilus junonius]
MPTITRKAAAAESAGVNAPENEMAMPAKWKATSSSNAKHTAGKGGVFLFHQAFKIRDGLPDLFVNLGDVRLSFNFDQNLRHCTSQAHFKLSIQECNRAMRDKENLSDDDTEDNTPPTKKSRPSHTILSDDKAELSKELGSTMTVPGLPDFTNVTEEDIEDEDEPQGGAQKGKDNTNEEEEVEVEEQGGQGSPSESQASAAGGDLMEVSTPALEKICFGNWKLNSNPEKPNWIWTIIAEMPDALGVSSCPRATEGLKQLLNDNAEKEKVMTYVYVVHSIWSSHLVVSLGHNKVAEYLSLHGSVQDITDKVTWLLQASNFLYRDLNVKERTFNSNQHSIGEYHPGTLSVTQFHESLYGIGARLVSETHPLMVENVNAALPTPSPTPRPPLLEKKNCILHWNGYEVKPQTPSYKPYALNNPGKPHQQAFAVETYESLSPLSSMSAERWNSEARSGGLVKENQVLRDFQVEAANRIIQRGGDLCLVAPTGSGKSLVWALPLLVQKTGISLVIIPYTSLGHQDEAWCAVLIFTADIYVLMS